MNFGIFLGIFVLPALFFCVIMDRTVDTVLVDNKHFLHELVCWQIFFFFFMSFLWRVRFVAKFLEKLLWTASFLWNNEHC